MNTSLSKRPSIFLDMVDVLLCPTCDNRRENISAFLNISLDLSIPDKALNVTEAPPRLSQPNVDVISGSSLATQQSVELSALLRLHMQIETLDPDNMWHCSGCNDKVQALKYHEYTVLPKSLMIHFKRFRYNTVSSLNFSILYVNDSFCQNPNNSGAYHRLFMCH